jgi:hypothetical protein
MWRAHRWMEELPIDHSVVRFVLLGGTLSLFVHYKHRIHAPNSRDVVEATFVTREGTCYKLVPHVVPC